MSNWNTFYTGTETQINTAISQINSNCGFPNANTTTWAIAQEAYDQTFWFCEMPPPQGYMDGVGSWTQDQMTSGVTGVTQQQGQNNWWPPMPPV